MESRIPHITHSTYDDVATMWERCGNDAGTMWELTGYPPRNSDHDSLGQRFRILSTSTFALPLIPTAGGRCPQRRYADVHKIIMPMSTKSSCRCPQSRYDAGKCSRAFVPSKRVSRGDSSDILIPAQHVYSSVRRFRNSDDRKSRNAGFLEYPRTCIPACFCAR